MPIQSRHTSALPARRPMQGVAHRSASVHNRSYRWQCLPSHMHVADLSLAGPIFRLRPHRSWLLRGACPRYRALNRLEPVGPFARRLSTKAFRVRRIITCTPGSQSAIPTLSPGDTGARHPTRPGGAAIPLGGHPKGCGDPSGMGCRDPVGRRDPTGGGILRFLRNLGILRIPTIPGVF